MRSKTRNQDWSETRSIPDPTRNKLFFQDLPPDLQLAVYQGIESRLWREATYDFPSWHERDSVLGEEADDTINRHNRKRTMKEWLKFAETGE